jgi:hypothetical protein
MGLNEMLYWEQFGERIGNLRNNKLGTTIDPKDPTHCPHPGTLWMHAGFTSLAAKNFYA